MENKEKVVGFNPVENEEEAKVVDMVNSQGKLNAVKWYKETHKCSLAEAKDAVNSICAKHNVGGGASGSSGAGCSVVVLIGVGLTLGAMALI